MPADPAKRPTKTRLAEIKPSPTLQYFSQPASQSGAVTFKLGDRFDGPGIVTVGWLGAKKQIVLPAGEWVAFAAVDFESPHARPVALTSIALGKFSGHRLSAAFFVTASRHSTDTLSWSELDACEQPDARRLYQWQRPSSVWQRECVTIKVVGNALPRGAKFLEELRESLKRLDAVTYDMAIVSDMHFADKTNGYLRVVRVDWPAVMFSDAASSLDDWRPTGVAASNERTAYAKALVNWIGEYQKFAGKGFKREILGADLTPGTRASGTSAVSGIGEFDPTKIAELVSR